jgi:primosomal protein N' (replication factor Y)
MSKIAEILLPLPFNKSFSYSFSQKISFGDIVKVPIKIITEKPKYRIKEIIEKANFLQLNSKLVQFLQEVSRYNMAFYGLVLKLAISIINQKVTAKYFSDHPKKEKEFIQIIDIRQFRLSKLNEEQGEAFRIAKQHLLEERFRVSLLDGITGSGKTEVYFNLIAEILQKNSGQILILLPEINLTTQLISRFKDKFGFEPVIWHSKISPIKKARFYQSIVNEKSRVIIGARSALFLPFLNLNFIVVDEEHDASFKQEDAINYNGRDMAVLRAKIENIPIMLCSATPSLESLMNSKKGKYQYLSLNRRFANQKKNDINLIDLRKEKIPKNSSLSQKILFEIADNLKKKQQSLLFLNRRGYAPLVICKSCGHKIECVNCSSYQTYHHDKRILTCHHCGYKQKFHHDCKVCGAKESIIKVGIGIEKLHEEIACHFPEAKVLTISSDTFGDVKEAEKTIKQIQYNEIDIIIGTQIISKGYHFPMLSLVAVVDADSSFFNSDLRASERSYQLLSQVIGRAGRENIPGKVFLQSYNPENIVFQNILLNQRNNFFKNELKNRELLKMPPFSAMSSVIFSDNKEERAMDLARDFSIRIGQAALQRFYDKKFDFEVLGPSPAALLRLKKKYHYKILIKYNSKFNIQNFMGAIVEEFRENRDRIKIDIGY